MNNKEVNPQNNHIHTDTSRIVHRHLADKNDEITEEDMRSVRISTDLPPEAITTTGAEAASIARKEDEEQPSDRPVTPWDLVD